MLLSLRKNGLTSLFKEVRVFKECRSDHKKFRGAVRVRVLGVTPHHLR